MISLHEKLIRKVLYSYIFENKGCEIAFESNEHEHKVIKKAIKSTKLFYEELNKTTPDAKKIYETNSLRVAAGKEFELVFGYSWPF